MSETFLFFSFCIYKYIFSIRIVKKTKLLFYYFMFSVNIFNIYLLLIYIKYYLYYFDLVAFSQRRFWSTLFFINANFLYQYLLKRYKKS